MFMNDSCLILHHKRHKNKKSDERVGQTGGKNWYVNKGRLGDGVMCLTDFGGNLDDGMFLILYYYLIKKGKQ